MCLPGQKAGKWCLSNPRSVGLWRWVGLRWGSPQEACLQKDGNKNCSWLVNISGEGLLKLSWVILMPPNTRPIRIIIRLNPELYILLRGFMFYLLVRALTFKKDIGFHINPKSHFYGRCIFTNPTPLGQDMTQGQFLNGV